MALVQTDFLPHTHGFPFANAFDVRLPLHYDLPLGGSVDVNAVSDGLCGGMCFAALDYFQAGQRPPAVADEGLQVYLRGRHLDSLKPETILKIMELLLVDGERGKRLLQREILKLRRQLDKGKPVVLALLFSGTQAGQAASHFGVAVGYEHQESPSQFHFNLYDPNHPGATQHLVASLAGGGLTYGSAALLGLLVIPFKPSPNPPRQLWPEQALAFAAETAPAFRLRWPVDSRRVNQYFGENPESYRGFGLPGHEGLDLYAPSGANIYAAADGEVYQAGFPKNHPYGRHIRIRHRIAGKTVHTVYAHLSEIRVGVGQHVAAGEWIGNADNTGNSRGSHLHLTLKIEGEGAKGYPAGVVDPWPYLKDSPAVEPEPGVGPFPPPGGVEVFTTIELYLRRGPSTDAEGIAVLPAGERLQVLGNAAEGRPKIGRQGEWLAVLTASGQAGYAAAWFLQDTRQAFPPSDLVIYPFDQLNLRAGPGTGFELLAMLTLNDPLTVLGDAGLAREKLGRKNEWIQVETEKGQRGFVAAWLARATGQSAPASGLTVYPIEWVNLRARPSTQDNILAVVLGSDALAVLGDTDLARAKIGQAEQWLNVRTPAGLEGYVAAWLVRTQAPRGPGQVGLRVIASADLNLRKQPSVNSPRVSGLFANEVLNVLEPDLAAARLKIGQPEQWIYGENSKGERGWAAAWFLKAA
ncbi:membrane proteins related to metalloendopeptidases [Longilinea arvoryzae]|uniref:Membrane proteins related to metalloendopeptidases n=1 Tax=Longilinea arvoryzae TaxID=360412 RepID=A0A0S7BHV0_9CHLR|nr:SH3 domain-containing protein [Longilinea arvoryzae]GAP13714.1 membrane proteins related to metalloendopeptidases [Longilinea arvoryzae]